MVCDHLKHRFVGRAGEMLGITLRHLVKDGEVDGFAVFESLPGRLLNASCGLCANDSECLISLELRKLDELAIGIRLVTGSVCLPLCTECLRMLKDNFKTTRG